MVVWSIVGRLAHSTFHDAAPSSQPSLIGLLAEAQGEWIILTLVEPPALPAMAPPEAPAQAVPTPPDSWFKLLGDRKFESEKEVEFYFVMPILEQLGYTEDWDSRTMYAALPKGEK